MINKKLLIKVLPIFAYVISPLLSLLVLPFITRVIDPGDYGLYNYYISLLNIILLFILFPSINSSILRFLNVNFDEYKKDKSVITNLTIFCTFIYVIVTLIVFLIYKDVLFIYLSIVFYFIYIMNFYKSFLNVNGKKVRFSLILLSITLIQYTTLFIFYIFFELNVYHLMIGNLLFSVVFAMYLIITNRKGIKELYVKIPRKEYKKILKFAIPSMGIALAGIILSTGDRILIKNLLEDGDFYVGIYSVNYTVYAQIIDLVVAVFYLYIPYLLYTKYEKFGEKSYLIGLEDILDKYLLVITLITLLAIFNYDKINYLLFDSRYLVDSKLSIYVLVGQYYFGVYRIISNYYLTINKQKVITVLLTAVAILNIILNIIFIPIYGYIAAAVTTLFCYIVLFIITYVCFLKHSNKNIISISNAFVIILPLILAVFIHNPHEFIGTNEALYKLIRDSIFILVLYLLFYSMKIRKMLRNIKQ